MCRSDAVLSRYLVDLLNVAQLANAGAGVLFCEAGAARLGVLGAASTEKQQ